MPVAQHEGGLKVREPGREHMVFVSTAGSTMKEDGAGLGIGLKVLERPV
jgi:hypothetical protein